MTRRVRTSARVVACVAFLAIVAMAALAFARPGGGHSYSGGGGGGGSGGSWGGGGYSGGGGTGGHSNNGGGELIFALLQLLYYLVVEVPFIGIPLVLVILCGVIWFAMQNNSDRGSSDWSTSYGVESHRPMPIPTTPSAAPVRVRELLDRIRTFDPAFSPVLFEDFVYALYAAAHEARGAKKLETLAAYLSPNARTALAQLSPNATNVSGVVVGAMRITSVTGLAPTDPRVVIRVTYESNYTETLGDRTATFYAVESWRFERDRNVRSKPADRARVLACPNCGASLDQTIGGTCAYCRQNVGTGAFDWVVAAISLEQREERGAQLTGTVPERGTERPSIVDANAPTRWAEIQQRDPSLEWTTFQARMHLIFRELQTAWSTRSWERARAFVSDNLFQSFAYWMQMYERQGLRNVTDNARITRVEIVRVTTDAFFDAITVRLWASGLDYTVDAHGHVVGGSKTDERAYSEYWTFVRGVAKRGEAKSDGKCPNCGADLKINMAGHCEYCRAKVTTGDFDWVLSRIEQDESYTG
jgi:predicted lipid-binding transport protein (Tim44 family)